MKAYSRWRWSKCRGCFENERNSSRSHLQIPDCTWKHVRGARCSWVTRVILRDPADVFAYHQIQSSNRGVLATRSPSSLAPIEIPEGWGQQHGGSVKGPGGKAPHRPRLVRCGKDRQHLYKVFSHFSSLKLIFPSDSWLLVRDSILLVTTHTHRTRTHTHNTHTRARA